MQKCCATVQNVKTREGYLPPYCKYVTPMSSPHVRLLQHLPSSHVKRSLAMSRKRKHRPTEPFHLSSVNTLALIPTDPSFPAGLLWFPSVLPHTFTRPSRYFRIGPLNSLFLQRNRRLREPPEQICPALPVTVCMAFHNPGLNGVTKRLFVK